MRVFLDGEDTMLASIFMRFTLVAFSFFAFVGCTKTNTDHTCVGGVCQSAPADFAVRGGARDLGVVGGGDLAGAADMTAHPSAGNGKLDVLFMIDNSPSMDAMQTQLIAQFGDFIGPLGKLASPGHPLDLHIGVVTSDYGAGSTPNLSGGCGASPGGQKGILQATAAAGTAAATAGCKGPTGVPYIQYTDDGNGHVSSNAPVTVVDAFSCMASVGSMGCGFEHQLESVYAALHNSVENAGFSRPDALLVVVFLTNEDDGSAPPTTDVFTPDAAKTMPPPAGYGALDTYRQTHFGVACQFGGALQLTPYGDSGGALAGCAAAENDNSVMLGAEYDVSRYIDFFTRPASQGGVKADPSRVILAAIDAPESPIQIIQVAAGTGNGKGAYPSPAAYQACPAPNMVDGISCLVRVQHSCQNVADASFFGDPALRLNSVVQAAATHQVTSICGADLSSAPDYSAPMQNLADLIQQRL
jgi:hypothetical protein